MRHPTTKLTREDSPRRPQVKGRAWRRGFVGCSAELGGRRQATQELAVPGAQCDGRLLKRPPVEVERNRLSRLVEGVGLVTSPPLGDGTPDRQMEEVPTVDLVATER